MESRRRPGPGSARPGAQIGAARSLDRRGRIGAERGPDRRSPDWRRPDRRGPDRRGPDRCGPDWRRPDRRGPDRRGPDRRDPRPGSACVRLARPGLARPDSWRRVLVHVVVERRKRAAAAAAVLSDGETVTSQIPTATYFGLHGAAAATAAAVKTAAAAGAGGDAGDDSPPPQPLHLRIDLIR